ncbi:Acetyltransferase (GNAT) domain-containing protein [Thermomonospora echinospora]|uniref:Acetyltransferase (GNAT) domain-containing protein n=2 Tax=Thermomonospora echinospora TaxID=1992 RepID=A0A1H5SUR1_9ACTN|nr:Acetyltransferase (GNAT) domain-containing protein [Thermomonospora echinospora]
MAVREAQARDLALLPEIERSADGVFASLGIVFPPGPTVIEEVGADARVLVVGEPPVGFAAVVELDGHPHLEQIALSAGHTGRGIGGLLLERVVAQATGPLTLITFRHVPWNGPWYARHGFTELPEERWGPQLRAHWQAEIDGGLHALGPRLVMCRRSG